METNHHESSFQFISQWNLILITLLFATMAIIEFKHTHRLSTFQVHVAPSRLHRSMGSDGPQLVDEPQIVLHAEEEEDQRGLE